MAFLDGIPETPAEIGKLLRSEFPMLEWEVEQYSFGGDYSKPWNKDKVKVSWYGDSHYELKLYPRGKSLPRIITMRMRHRNEGYVRYWDPEKRAQTSEWGTIPGLVSHLREIMRKYYT